MLQIIIDTVIPQKYVNLRKWFSLAQESYHDPKFMAMRRPPHFLERVKGVKS